MSAETLYSVTIVATQVDRFDVVADNEIDARDRCIAVMGGETIEGVTFIAAANGERFDLKTSVIVEPRILDARARIVFYLLRWLLGEVGT